MVYLKFATIFVNVLCIMLFNDVLFIGVIIGATTTVTLLFNLINETDEYLIKNEKFLVSVFNIKKIYYSNKKDLDLENNNSEDFKTASLFEFIKRTPKDFKLLVLPALLSILTLIIFLNFVSEPIMKKLTIIFIIAEILFIYISIRIPLKNLIIRNKINQKILEGNINDEETINTLIHCTNCGHFFRHYQLQLYNKVHRSKKEIINKCIYCDKEETLVNNPNFKVKIKDIELKLYEVSNTLKNSYQAPVITNEIYDDSEKVYKSTLTEIENLEKLKKYKNFIKKEDD